MVYTGVFKSKSKSYQAIETQTKFCLTPDQIHQFKQNGYLQLHGLVSTTEVGQIRKLLTNVFNQFEHLPEDFVHNLDSRQQLNEASRNLEILNCLWWEQKLARTQYFRNARTIARQLLGPEARMWFDHAILKPPQSNCATMWHQDEAYSQSKAANLQISFWLPLQDVTAESGCLHFIPNSHNRALLPHRNLADGCPALMTDQVDLNQAVICPLNVGDLSVHYGRTLHYAGPNTTDKSRLAWVLVFSVGNWLRRAQLMRLAVPMGRIFLGRSGKHSPA